MCESLIIMWRWLRCGGPGGFVRACAYGEISPGQIRRVDGLPVLLCRSGDRIFAVGWMCTHAAARLAKGRLVDDCLECPLHGARFALDGGAVRRGPARRRLPSYEVQVRDGQVYVARYPRRQGLLRR
ncbi:MAG TPA: non-heme iron oxygenase ferredoxin subunit [Streptosporangiaceae bacterium]|nr:non-heme iron oxygenase ferredoxin subunit [Streptosporangiaceae bacterium]